MDTAFSVAFLLGLLLAALPSKADTSQQLIDNGSWQGATYGNDPGGCCASISGSGALYDYNTQTIMFSYGQDILSQTIAINDALQASGIQVDGFNYSWKWRRISNNGRGGDTLRFEVTVKDSSGNQVEDYVYDYSNIGADDIWYSSGGTETFANSYLDPQNIQLRIIGKDGGFWAGYYGPEVKDVSLTLNYTADPCAANPLYDPACSGYAEAYAEQQYQLNCQANPLYDSGCPGYAQAYFDQQCNADPLYNQSCPGYASAYFDYQCSVDPLYDSACPGYAEALYDQNCSSDPLFDSGCPGYETAYYNLQCSINTLYDSGCPGYAEAYYLYQCGLDPLYDRNCDGYAEAYAQENILNEQTTDTTETVSTTSETILPVTDPEEIGMPSTTGDSTVDSILSDLSTSPTVTVVVAEPVADVAPEPSQQEVQEVSDAQAEPETSASDDIGAIEVAGGDDSESSDESEGESSDGGDSESEKKDSKREKMKKAIAKKASQLAESMSEAASLEAQQAAQATVLALINYTPGFDQYGVTMSGGYYPDAAAYPDTQLPESRRGLRNGLAQQLLHEKMIDMQYNKD